MLSDALIRGLRWCLKFNSNTLARIYVCPQTYATSEGVVSHDVLYYQQFSIARYQVSLYANIYFE